MISTNEQHSRGIECQSSVIFLLDNHYKTNFVNLYPDTRGVEHK